MPSNSGDFRDAFASGNFKPIDPRGTVKNDVSGVNPDADMPLGGKIPPTQTAAADALADVAARGIALIDAEIAASQEVRKCEDLIDRVVEKYTRAGVIEPNKVYVLDGRCLVVTIERGQRRVVMLPIAEATAK